MGLWWVVWYLEFVTKLAYEDSHEEFGVQSFGYRVQGYGIWVQGLEFRVGTVSSLRSSRIITAVRAGTESVSHVSSVTFRRF